MSPLYVGTPIAEYVAATERNERLGQALSKFGRCTVTAVANGDGANVFGSKPDISALCARFGFRFSGRTQGVYLTGAKVSEALAAFGGAQ